MRMSEETGSTLDARLLRIGTCGLRVLRRENVQQRCAELRGRRHADQISAAEDRLLAELRLGRRILTAGAADVGVVVQLGQVELVGETQLSLRSARDELEERRTRGAQTETAHPDDVVGAHE